MKRSDNIVKEYSNCTTDLRSKFGMSLVTGGAGFIGSHIVDKFILNNAEVKVLDNLSTGSVSNLSQCINNKKFYFIRGDLNHCEYLTKALQEVRTIFHIAAHPEVRTGINNPRIAYEENIRNTFYLLEEIRKSSTVDSLIFTSSSTIYGDPNTIPTPEDYGLPFPVSIYAASKLACESLISSYCHTYGIKGWIFRLANVVGSRSRHGVVWDFIKKLRINSRKLEILGDGLQSKSFIHITDCIESLFHCLLLSNPRHERMEVFNIGNEDKIDVISIAKTVCNVMNLKDVKLVTTGGVDNGRGWTGDVKIMQLDISKLKKLGWYPKLSSMEAIAISCNELLHEIEGFG
jgi:UDP-glucose 4-epimerase